MPLFFARSGAAVAHIRSHCAFAFRPQLYNPSREGDSAEMTSEPIGRLASAVRRVDGGNSDNLCVLR